MMLQIFENPGIGPFTPEIEFLKYVKMSIYLFLFILYFSETQLHYHILLEFLILLASLQSMKITGLHCHKCAGIKYAFI